MLELILAMAAMYATVTIAGLWMRRTRTDRTAVVGGDEGGTD